MIKPTTGRSILFRPIDEDEGEEHAAIIAFVHDDNHVNLAIFDSNGLPYNRQNVYLNQEPDDTVFRGQAFWMPYQHSEAGIKPMSFARQLAARSMASHLEEALESGDAEILSGGDPVVIDDNNQPEVAGAIINRQLASHQINQEFAVQ